MWVGRWARHSHNLTSSANRHNDSYMLRAPFFPLQGDLPAAAVRRMIGPERILGVSVKTVEEVSGLM
jgi:hypothetical protein